MPLNELSGTLISFQAPVVEPTIAERFVPAGPSSSIFRFAVLCAQNVTKPLVKIDISCVPFVITTPQRSALAPDVPMRTIEPGESLVYRFTATKAGIWMYHCSTMPMSAHIANGMFGAVVKGYWYKVANVPLEQVFSVSVMPCTAKKSECIRPQLQSNPGIPDVDCVITTRELARMIKNAGIEFKDLPEEEFDSPLGESTGAAAIFGPGTVIPVAAQKVLVELNERLAA